MKDTVTFYEVEHLPSRRPNIKRLHLTQVRYWPNGYWETEDKNNWFGESRGYKTVLVNVTSNEEIEQIIKSLLKNE